MVPLQHHRGTTMDHYAGIDVSLEYSSICVVDATGNIAREDKDRQRTRGAHRLVRFIGLCADPDRPGGWSALAMALRGDEESWAGGRAFRNAARARCLQGDAGEVRSQRRARDCAADAAWLVSAGALQVDWGPGDSRRTDCTQAGRIEASRHRE